VLDLYGCKEVRPGVHEAVAAIQMRVVALAELPRARDTLLLRLLGAGRVLREALADLAALPKGAWERGVTTPLLLHFGLIQDGLPAAGEEEDVSEEIRAWYEDYLRKQEKLQADKLNQGRVEGEVKGEARALLATLRARGIQVPDAARERILAEKDPERLERWVERAAVASSLADVLDDPS
jgi:hypothetical protein